MHDGHGPSARGRRAVSPIFGPGGPGYHENAYDVYTYVGAHLNCAWDINARLEWYYDQNGGGYPGAG